LAQGGLVNSGDGRSGLDRTCPLRSEGALNRVL